MNIEIVIWRHRLRTVFHRGIRLIKPLMSTNDEIVSKYLYAVFANSAPRASLTDLGMPATLLNSFPNSLTCVRLCVREPCGNYPSENKECPPGLSPPNVASVGVKPTESQY